MHLVITLVVFLAAPASALSQSDLEEEELAAARAVFAANLSAIQNKDVEAYLACYWQSPRLTRNGNFGPTFGYREWAAGMGEGWPQVLDAKAVQLRWLRPGLVYGSYRYRVVFDGDETTGMSERVFLKTEDGWKIAVSTAFENPESVAPPAVILSNCTLWYGDGTIVQNAVLTLSQGAIACIGTMGDACGRAEDTDVIDCTGLTVMPDFSRGTPLAKDAPANLLVVDGNPSEDPTAMSRVIYVITGGEVRGAGE